MPGKQGGATGGHEPGESPQWVKAPVAPRVWGFSMIALGVLILFLFPDGIKVRGIPLWGISLFCVGAGLCALVLPKTMRAKLEDPRGASPDELWESPQLNKPRAEKAASITLEGVFEPPVFTSRARPYPLAGEGKMTISSGGLGIRAYTIGGGIRSILLLVPAAAAVTGGVGVLTAMLQGIRVPWWIVLAVATVAGVVLYAAPHVRASKGERVTQAISWSRIVGFREAAGDRIEILVTNTTPQGVIHFRPPDRAHALDALRARGTPAS